MRKRRIICIILCLSIFAAFAGSCASKTQVTPYSPREIVEAILSAQSEIPALHPLPPDDAYYPEYLSNIYEINGVEPIDGMIYYSYGMTADEIAVFKLADTAEATAVKDALIGYKERRASIFSGYAPYQSAVAENGAVVVHGNYVALLICKDPKNAESVFLACFSDDPPDIIFKYEPVRQTPEGEDEDAGQEQPADSGSPQDAEDGAGADNNADSNTGTDKDNGISCGNGTEAKPEPTDSPEPDDGAGNAAGNATDPSATSDPGATVKPPVSSPPASTEEPPDTAEPGQNPDTTDTYNKSAILAAWKSGDPSKLSTKNKSILDSCVKVINSLITTSMTDYDKELVIHNWIIKWADYDTEALSNAPDAAPDPDNDNPYGLLMNKRAICRGFTYTFQLFMDMLGVECITIEGSSGQARDEHAWNMVRIDGEWYCVDVTWNNPIGSGDVTWGDEITHKYFNVTSKFMRDTGHHWDNSDVPEASAPKLYFG